MKADQALAAIEQWWSPAPALDAPAPARAEAATLAAAGREHLLAARSAVDQRLAGSATSLYGRAIGYFARAKAGLAAPLEGATGADAPPDPAALVAASSAKWLRPEARDDAALLLREPQATGTLSARRRRRALASLERIATEAGREVYPLSAREVFLLCWRRRATAVAAIALAFLALHLWIKSPHNVARGKPVTASSVRMGAPQALTNGAIEWGTFGLHTGGSGREWALIDLQKFYALDYAEIYSRGDGRFEFNLPLTVETSADGTTFKASGSCADPFTQATPCVVDLHRVRARYVRVSAPEIVLAEVEVYGK